MTSTSMCSWMTAGNDAGATAVPKVDSQMKQLSSGVVDVPSVASVFLLNAFSQVHTY